MRRRQGRSRRRATRSVAAADCLTACWSKRPSIAPAFRLGSSRGMRSFDLYGALTTLPSMSRPLEGESCSPELGGGGGRRDAKASRRQARASKQARASSSVGLSPLRVLVLVECNEDVAGADQSFDDVPISVLRRSREAQGEGPGGEAGSKRGAGHHPCRLDRPTLADADGIKKTLNSHSPDERIFSMSAALGEALPPSWACGIVVDVNSSASEAEREEGKQEREREKSTPRSEEEEEQPPPPTRDRRRRPPFPGPAPGSSGQESPR